MLEIKDVTVKFGGVTALNAVSANFTQTVGGIIGPNGAGKTTLMNVLSGFVQPIAGSVTRDGQDLLTLAPHRRAHWGLRRSFQREEIADDLTTFDNVMVQLDHGRAASSNHRNEVEQALAFVGMSEQAYALGAELNTFQRRLTDIAKCMVGQPRIVMFDEPAGGLSVEESKHLGDLIRKMGAETGAQVLVIDHDVDLIRKICVEKRPETQVADLAEAFPHARIASGYGLTETNVLGLFGAGPDYVAHPSSSGRLVPPLQEARFVGDDGKDVAPGDVGELALRGCNIMRGYLNNPDATAKAIQGGWFHTGDLARCDDEGFVYIVGRKKEVIIRGGENIACLELDSALYAHPGVIEAHVFSVPDDRLGEIVGAAVYRTPGSTLDAAQLSEFLKGQLAAYKIPVRYWFTDGPLPRTTTDKIDRRALLARCLETL